MVAMVAQRGNGPTARPVRLICIVAAGNYHFYSKRHNQRNHGLFPGYASMLHMEAGEAKMNPTSEIFWLHLQSECFLGEMHLWAHHTNSFNRLIFGLNWRCETFIARN